MNQRKAMGRNSPPRNVRGMAGGWRIWMLVACCHAAVFCLSSYVAADDSNTCHDHLMTDCDQMTLSGGFHVESEPSGVQIDVSPPDFYANAGDPTPFYRAYCSCSTTSETVTLSAPSSYTSQGVHYTFRRWYWRLPFDPWTWHESASPTISITVDNTGTYISSGWAYHAEYGESVGELAAVDPIPDMTDLITGDETHAGLLFTSDRLERLAGEGRPVLGAAADGVTRLLLRARVPGPGTVTFSLVTPAPGGGPVAPGVITDIAGSKSGEGLSTDADVVSAGGAYYAFALYQTPDGCADMGINGLPVDIWATFTDDHGAASQLGPLTISLYQPPVVLLHGLWANTSAWWQFPLKSGDVFPWVYRYGFLDNAAPLALNVSEVHQAVEDACYLARHDGVVACRADVIGHSMGGVLGRYWGRVSNDRYQQARNWYQGDIRRLITMNSPHYGTRLADWALALAARPDIGEQLRSRMREIGHPLEGAVEDLRWGSSALRAMGASRVEGHALVGNVNWGTRVPVSTLASYLSDIWDEELLDLLAAADVWYDPTALFGGSRHDLVVSCESQAGGLQGKALTERAGYEFWHCGATRSATFANDCKSLLTAPADSGAFSPFPALPADLPAGAPLSSVAASRRAASASASDLIITSPSEGTLVSPGWTLEVRLAVVVGPTLTASAVLGPRSYGESQPGAPEIVMIGIPADAVGDYPIFALGQLQDGSYVCSPAVHLGIDLSGREPVALDFAQSRVSIQPHDRVATMCLLGCPDDVVRAAAGASAGLAYESTQPGVATVDSEGVVTGVAPGLCSIVAHRNDLTASLSVTVREPVADFLDVPVDSWAFYAIRALLRADIVQGFSANPPLYRPELPVTRDQMAVYISRALAGGDAYVPSGPATATFDDVPVDHWAFRYVEYAKANNIVQGYDPHTYGPGIELDRGQMAVFVARAMVTPSGDAGIPDPTPPAIFPDVPASFWAYKQVEYCVGQGVVQGYDDGTYRPIEAVTRDQMAVYVARAFQLPM